MGIEQAYIRSTWVPATGPLLLENAFIKNEILIAKHMAKEITDVLIYDKNLNPVYSWKKLSPENKRGAVGEMAKAIFSRLGEAGPIPVFFGKFKNHSDACFSRTDSAVFFDSRIHLCPLNEVIETTTHEAAHYRQFKIESLCISIPTEFEPVRATLKMEAMNYINPWQDFDAYKNQLCEQHAAVVCKTVTEEMLNLLYAARGTPSQTPKQPAFLRRGRMHSIFAPGQ